jgi:UDP-N-acetyl-D-glucosamine dehydrogenase
MGAEVRVADPHVVEDALDRRLTRVDLTEKEVDTADAVVVLVDHDAFDLTMVGRRASYVFDSRQCVSGDQVEHL